MVDLLLDHLILDVRKLVDLQDGFRELVITKVFERALTLKIVDVQRVKSFKFVFFLFDGLKGRVKGTRDLIKLFCLGEINRLILGILMNRANLIERGPLIIKCNTTLKLEELVLLVVSS